jgi:hypothetical protein
MIDECEGALVIPDRRQALFEDVYGQMHRLHTHWRLYVTFFGSREAVEVVSRAGMFTFGVLQDVLFEAIVLGLDRLLASSSADGDRPQASVARLVTWIPQEDAGLARELRKRLTRLRADCTQVTERRKRIVAHRDLAIALKDSSLDDVGIRTVRHALEELSAILTSLSAKYYGGMPCNFRPDMDADAFDADVLLERLAQLS